MPTSCGSARPFALLPYPSGLCSPLAAPPVPRLRATCREPITDLVLAVPLASDIVARPPARVASDIMARLIARVASDIVTCPTAHIASDIACGPAGVVASAPDRAARGGTARLNPRWCYYPSSRAASRLQS